MKLSPSYTFCKQRIVETFDRNRAIEASIERTAAERAAMKGMPEIRDKEQRQCREEGQIVYRRIALGI